MMRSLVPLRHKGFRFLVGGQLASNFGDACYAVALPWYVLAEHGGTLLLGTVLVAYGVPRTVLVAFGGSASDRWRPWSVMMTSDLVRTVAAAALAVVAFAGPARAEFLIPVAVLLGAGEGLFLPGSFAIVPGLLPDDDLQAGNALSSSTTSLAALAGPAVGGALVAFLGPAPAFAIDAASFALSALSLAGVRSVQRRAGAAAPVVTPSGTKLTLRRLLRREPVLVIIMAIVTAANLGSGGLGEVAIPALAHGPLHTGASGYGILVAAMGAGALVGTLAAGAVRRFRRPAIVGSMVYLAEVAFAALAPYVGGPVGAGVALALFGLMNGFANIVVITAIQRWAPPQVLGRVMSILVLSAFGIFPISVAFGALVVNGLGAAAFFPISAGILALAVLGGLASRRWRDLGSTSGVPVDVTPENQPSPQPSV
jgi:MFS family permease